MNNPPAPPDRQAALLAIVAITLFSAKPILIKWAYGYGIDASALMLLRLLMAAPLFLMAGLWAMRYRRARLGDIGLACGLGFLGSYVAGLLDMLGLEYITAQLERMLLFTYPIFTVLFSWAIYRRRPGPGIYLCMGLTYGGLALMFVTDLAALGDDVILGTVLVLASAVTFAAYMVLSREPIQRMGSLPFAAIVMLFSTLCMLIHQWLRLPAGAVLQSLQHFPDTVYVIAALLAVLGTFIPGLLATEAVRRIGPEQVSLLGNAGPVITSLLAIALLDEAFTLWHALGMALIVAGLWVLQHPPVRLIAARN